MSFRNLVQSIAKKAMRKEISIQDAEILLFELFKNNPPSVNEKQLEPLKRKRIYKIINLDGSKCFYCGNKTFIVEGKRMNNSSTIDHLLPKKKGGVDHIDNCVNACNKCNNSKGSDSILPKRFI